MFLRSLQEVSPLSLQPTYGRPPGSLNRSGFFGEYMRFSSLFAVAFSVLQYVGSSPLEIQRT
eukprot:gene40812-54018_t